MPRKAKKGQPAGSKKTTEAAQPRKPAKGSGELAAKSTDPAAQSEGVVSELDSSTVESDAPVAAFDAAHEARYGALAEKLASVMTAAGFPAMPARVQMALVFSAEGALTSAELEERLSISPAAVSGAVNWLTTVGFVSRRAQPGSRRKLIALTDEAWFTVSFRQATTYNAIEGVLAEALDEPADPGSIGSDRLARLTELRDFFDFMKRRMPSLLEEWRAAR